MKKCVLLCGGLGTRLLPISKTVSKELMSINLKPALYYQLEEIYKSGFREVIIVCTKRNINLIKNFLSKDKYLNNFIKNDKDKLNKLDSLYEIVNNLKIKYVIQEIKGTYGALYSARHYLNNEYFGLIYCDDLIDSDVPILKQLIDRHNITHNMIVATMSLNKNEYPNFGLIKYNNNLIEDLVYKKEINTNTCDILQGRFILHTKVFKIKKDLKFINNELQLPTSLLKFKNELEGYNYFGNYLDIGNNINLLKTNLYYAFKDENIKKELLNYIDKIK